MLPPLVFKGCSELSNNIDHSSSVPATVNYPVRGCRGVEGRGRKAGNSAAGGGRGRGKAARAK